MTDTWVCFVLAWVPIVLVIGGYVAEVARSRHKTKLRITRIQMGLPERTEDDDD